MSCPVGVSGSGLSAVLDPVPRPVPAGFWCGRGAVVLDGELPAVNVVERVGGGGIDDGAYGEGAGGGVVVGFDGGVCGAGAVGVEAEGPGWWSVSMDG